METSIFQCLCYTIQTGRHTIDQVEYCISWLLQTPKMTVNFHIVQQMSIEYI